MENANTRRRRLQWKCRRGMLELDWMFNSFLKSGYNELTELDQEIFDKLLSEHDQQLFVWFFSEGKPELPEYQYVIEKIRSAITT